MYSLRVTWCNWLHNGLLKAIGNTAILCTVYDRVLCSWSYCWQSQNISITWHITIFKHTRAHTELRNTSILQPLYFLVRLSLRSDDILPFPFIHYVTFHLIENFFSAWKQWMLDKTYSVINRMEYQTNFTWKYNRFLWWLSHRSLEKMHTSKYYIIKLMMYINYLKL